MPRIRRGIALAGAVAAVVGLTPAVANATPSSGVSATIISKVTVDGKDYILRQITSDCTTAQVYSRGATFVETSGADNVHIGRNLGPTPLTLDVLYVDPAGSPLSEDAPNPGCDFQ
ncbi:MAG: cupin [Catenulisporales bacterium]|nr:cupin [Catenulisporales bacterium]